MTISDAVPGGIPSSSIAAIRAGLAKMDLLDLDVLVTDDSVATVRNHTDEGNYHDDRNGGSVAARTVTTSGGGVVVVANWETLSTLTDVEVERVLAHEAGHASIDVRGGRLGRGRRTLPRALLELPTRVRCRRRRRRVPLRGRRLQGGLPG